MDHDSHWSLVKFDTDYWNLVERCFSVTQSAEGVATETCVEHATASARPQGSRCYTAEYFRSKFEAMEREFSEEFKVMSRPPASTEDDDNRDGEQAQVAAQVDNVRHLSNLLGVYNELIALRRLSVALRRRCVFLENVQSLLRSQNLMLTGVVTEETRRIRATALRRRAAAADPSSKTKRPASSKQQPAAGSTAVEKDLNVHRPLQYQGSGGLDGNSRYVPADGPAPEKLQHRSMSVGSLVDLDHDVGSSAGRRESSADGLEATDQQDRKPSGKLQEKWQQVKKAITGKLDVGGATTSGGKTKVAPMKSGSAKTRSASTTSEMGGVRTGEPCQLQLLTVQQPEYRSRSISPRTPSTVDSGSCRVPSNTGSSSIGHDATDRTLADVEDSWSGESAPRRKSVPNDQQKLLSVASTASVGRSNSFNTLKSTGDRLTLGSAEGSGSKSWPASPAELAASQTTEQAGPSTVPGSNQRAKTAWTKVKDIVSTARRGSADALAPDVAVVDGRSASAERCRPSVVDDDRDPWIEKRPRATQGTVASDHDDGPGRSSTSPPGSGEHLGRKRFSVSHATSTLGAATVRSSSPLDLAGLLAAGVSEEFTKKMEEWENRKKKTVGKAENLDSASQTKFTEDFIRKMEEWEQKKFAADDSGIRSSSPKTADRHPGKTVDDSVIQSKLSESFSRTVQDWERVRQSRSKSQSMYSSAAAPSPPARTADSRGKSRERDKSRQRAEKELSKLVKKEQKLEEELQRLVASRIRLETQLESSSASDRGAGSRGDSDWGASADDERLLAALDLLQNVDDRMSASSSFSERQRRSKSARLRRQSCVISSSTASGFQRATSVGDAGRIRTDRKTLSAAGPRCPAAASSAAEHDSDSRQSEPAKLTPTLEDANRSLRRQIEEKSDTIGRLQSEIQQLVDRINSMETEHSSELDRCRKESRLCSGCSEHTRLSAAVTSSLDKLQQQLRALRRDFDNLRPDGHNNLDERREEKPGLGEGVVEEERHLLDAFSSGTPDSVLYTRYTVARLLLATLHRYGATTQFSALKRRVTERNSLIETLRRHVLVQEIANRLLVAEMDRLDLEIQYLGELRSRRVIRRWKTYHGQDRHFIHSVFPTRRADRLQWACPSSRVILDNVNDVLSQNGSVTSLDDSLLESLQQTLRDTASSETHVEADRTQDVEVQTTLSVSPHSVHATSSRSAGGQWPPQQQHQQMLQQLLLQRQQQRAPASPRSAAEQPRKGSAAEVSTDLGRSLASSAFRPVLTARAGDWSPSWRGQHEPRLPYFEVRDVTADAGKRFFRPIANRDDQPPASTDNVFDDSRQAVAAGSADTKIAGTSRDVPPDTATASTAERIPAESSGTAEPPLPPPSKSHKPSANYRTKLRRAGRSRTAELRLHPSSALTGNVSNSPTAQRQVPEDRKWTSEEDDDALFDSEAGSAAMSSVSARSRTKSDSSVSHSTASQAPSIVAGSLSPQDSGDWRLSAGWALDRGRPYPESAATDGARSLRSSPFAQSPSPLIVRKLKSAAELLRECSELHQQRRSRPASSSRLPVPTTAPQVSYFITETIVVPLPSTAPSDATAPGTQTDPNPPILPALTSDTDSALLPTSKTTAISSTLEQRTCASSGADSRPTEINSQSSAVESQTPKIRTETTISGKPAHSVATRSPESIHKATAPETPHGTIATPSHTAETVHASQSKFLDRNWFHVPKVFKS